MIWFRFRAAALAATVMLGLFASARALPAQYFGRNKVQYRTFDFKIIKTPHFDIYYYPDEAEAAQHAARMAERWYARLSTILDHRFEERQPVILYANHAEFQQTNVIGSIGEGTGGVTESAKQRVVLPFTGSYQEFDHVLGHELVHAFQYDISGLGRSRGGISAGARSFGTAPLWFTEGMAEYLSVGPVDPQTAMWLRDAALTGDIPTIERLSTDPHIFPYRYGHAVWAYIAGRWGDAVIGQILRLVGQGVPYPVAFERLLNTSLDEISEDWLASVRRAYLPLLAERPEARQVAEPLITRSGEGGRVNIAPALSPDGKRLAFLSELDYFDIELWLADAETGKVVRKLVKGTSFDPHFGSLRFLASAGSFSPDGKRLAFSALREGHDVIVILDVDRGEVLREIAIPGVPEITNPSWSPDGNTIVFSASKGGISDLYSLSIDSGKTLQLTNDWHADLMPSISPDGRYVAFVTDRSADANLSTLRWGGYVIATLDLQTGTIRVLPQTMDGNNINPQWARGGRGLYFTSDRSGIPNIYRLEMETGATFRVTDLFGGVMGYTDLSPVIAVARDADRLVFTAFEKGGFNIYALDEAEELAGKPVTFPLATGTPPLPAVLPPVPRPTDAPYNRVAQLLDDPTFGLPPAGQDTLFRTVKYRPRLSLDYLGTPQVGATTGGAFGRGGVYGGVAALWSDNLARHTVFGALQANGQLDEIGFAATYLYRRTRWNYGAAAQRVPYVYGFLTRDQQTGVFIPVRARTFNSSIQGLAQYPFSLVQRAEFSAGARRIAQDVQYYDLAQRDFVKIDRPSYNLLEASAALIYDNALTGYTSPFAGQRYRFEISPTIGDVRFTQALADYRKYFWFQPFTVAVRGLHFGRYADERSANLFSPLNLGFPSLVRGYYNTYETCTESGQDCDVLSQLIGSRIAVVNAELRFPLIRQLVVGPGIGFPPIEGIAFADAGVAWDRTAAPTFFRGIPRGVDGSILDDERGILTSIGLGARVNLFGYLIFEVDYVNPLERERGWHWQFAIQPGF